MQKMCGAAASGANTSGDRHMRSVAGVPSSLFHFSKENTLLTSRLGLTMIAALALVGVMSGTASA